MNEVIIGKVERVVTDFDRVLAEMIESIEILQQFFKAPDDTKMEV